MKKRLKRLSGGSCFHDARFCRAADRLAFLPDDCPDFFGFRLAAKKPSSDRSLRGGSYFGNASYCRTANRYYYPPAYRNVSFGFRLVATN